MYNRTLLALSAAILLLVGLAPDGAAQYACSHPVARGEVGPINSSGEFQLRAIPVDGWFEQWMYYWRGSWNFVPAGAGYANLSVMCMYEPSEIRIVPLDCYNNWYYPGEWSTNMGAFSTRPTVSASVKKAAGQPGARQVTLTWDMGLYNTPGDVRAWLLPWTSANGRNYVPSGAYGPSYAGQSGSYTFNVYVPDDGQQYILHAEARACSGAVRAVDDVAVDCDDCLTASKNPIHFNDGNMRLNDGDPLPTIAGLSLGRTYNSDEQVKALFGRGWTTVLDRRLMLHSLNDEQAVVVTTETNDLAIFRGAPGTYRQVWPKSRPANAALQYDSLSGTFLYRAAGDSRVAVFRESDGRLVELRDLATGRSASITHTTSADGSMVYPTAITDSWSGTSWNLAVDEANRRVTSISVGGRPDLVWTYGYDGAGNLLAVTAPGNAVWRTYEYDANRMTASRDGAGNLIESHTYDWTGLAVSSTGDGDEIESVQYNVAASNPGEQITRVVHRSGAISDYVLAPSGGAYRAVQVTGGCGSCGARDLTYVRDPRGRVIRTQHADGYITLATYDSEHLLSEQRFLRPASCDPATDPAHCRLGSSGLASATLTATGATTSTSYTYGDAAWPDRPTTISTDSVVVPGERRVETISYDAATGQVTQRTVIGHISAAAPAETHTTTTTLYNGTETAAFAPGGAFLSSWLTLPQPRGLRKSADGPRTDVTDVTQWVYYPIHSSVPSNARGKVAAVRNASGHVTRFENYDVFGTGARVVDANGVATETTFDSLGRVLTTTVRGVSGCDAASDPLCANDLTSTISYSPAAGPMSTQTDAAGGVTAYEHDFRGRVSAISRGLSAAALEERTEYTYDPATGRKSTERALARENGTWVEKRRESFTYDAFGELVTQTHTDGTSIGYTYDSSGAVATVRDENHTTANTRYEYDAAHRLAKVTQTLSGAPGGAIATSYAYDVAGNLVRVTDPNGNVTTYSYDDFGRMVSQTSPVTGISTYTYDPAGNVVSTTDANGTITTRTFDALGRVTSSTSDRPPRDPETVSWSYDDAAPSRFGIGRIASMTDPSGSTNYRYERRGHLASEAKTIGSQTFTSSFEYNATGNRSLIRYPSGRTVTYTFDYAGRPYSAAAGTTTLVFSARYLPFGPAYEIAYGNGTVKHMTYDTRYRPLTNALSGSGDPLVSYQYQYDNAGNVTAIYDQLDASFNRTFGYDDLNRLTAANTGGGLWGSGSYAYDFTGNVRALALGEQRSATFSYDGTTPRLVSVTENGRTRAVTYDAVGNERGFGDDAMTYMPSNHLEHWNATTYSYDGRGIRTVTTRAVRIASFSVNPSSVTGGSSAQGTITISSPAPAGGAVIALAASAAVVSVPATLTVAAGQTAVTFTVATATASGEIHAVITANFNGSSTMATLTVTGSRIDDVQMSPQSVTGGEQATGTIAFAAPTPEEGLSLTLRSSDPAVSVPSELGVRGGQRSAEFPVATMPVMRATTAIITITLDAEQHPTTLTVLPPAIATLTFASPGVRGGSSSVATITLTGAVAERGATILLTTTSRLLTTPPSVFIEGGTRSATFTVDTTPVESPVTAVVTATLGEQSTSASLVIEPPVLTNLTVTPAIGVGGEPMTAQPAIDGPAAEPGAAVSLSSSDPALIYAPAGVTIPAGATSTSVFLPTNPVASATPVVISASRQGVTRSTMVTLQPPPVTIQSLTVAPASLVGTNDAVATITLTASAPSGGLEVELTSSNSAAAIPPVLTIAAGLTSASVRVATSLVTSATNVTITAFHGTTEKSAVLALLPPAGNYVASIALTPVLVVGGSTTTGTITLAFPAADHGGSDVTLTSGNTAASVPPIVKVNPNATTATFTVATSVVSTPVPVVIAASFGGVVQRIQLVVAPENTVTVTTLGITPTRVMGGATASGTVTLSGPAPFGGARVTLEASRRNIVTMPPAVLIPEGATTATFPLVAGQLHSVREKVVEIVAAYNNVSATATLTVLPATQVTSNVHTPVAQCASLAPCLVQAALPKVGTLGEQDGGPTPLPGPSLFETQYTLYTPELALLSETAATSNATTTIAYDYVWFAGQPLAQIENATGTIARYFTDHLGTPIRQLDSFGRVLWHGEYEPYGSLYGIRRGEARHQPLRFPGQTSEDGSDLYQNVFRFYRAGVGRYTQADPMGLAAGTNLFAYAIGNPLGYIDPTGLEAAMPIPARPPAEICPFPRKPPLPKAGLGWRMGAIAILIDFLITPGELNPVEFEKNRPSCKVCGPKEVPKPKTVQCRLVSDDVDFVTKMRVCVYSCPAPVSPVVIIHPDYHTPCAPTYEVVNN